MRRAETELTSLGPRFLSEIFDRSLLIAMLLKMDLACVINARDRRRSSISQPVRRTTAGLIQMLLIPAASAVAMPFFRLPMISSNSNNQTERETE